MPPTFHSSDSPASLPIAASTSCCACGAVGVLWALAFPLLSPQAFHHTFQIFVLADKSLVLELSPGGQAVRAGGPLDPIQFPTPTAHAEKLRPRAGGGLSQGHQRGRGRVTAGSRLLEAE